MNEQSWNVYENKGPTGKTPNPFANGFSQGPTNFAHDCVRLFFTAPLCQRLRPAMRGHNSNLNERTENVIENKGPLWKTRMPAANEFSQGPRNFAGDSVSLSFIAPLCQCLRSAMRANNSNLNERTENVIENKGPLWKTCKPPTFGVRPFSHSPVGAGCQNIPPFPVSARVLRQGATAVLREGRTGVAKGEKRVNWKDVFSRERTQPSIANTGLSIFGALKTNCFLAANELKLCTKRGRRTGFLWNELQFTSRTDADG